jgi:hypothetical protein
MAAFQRDFVCLSLALNAPQLHPTDANLRQHDGDLAGRYGRTLPQALANAGIENDAFNRSMVMLLSETYAVAHHFPAPTALLKACQFFKKCQASAEAGAAWRAGAASP